MTVFRANFLELLLHVLYHKLDVGSSKENFLYKVLLKVYLQYVSTSHTRAIF